MKRKNYNQGLRLGVVMPEYLKSEIQAEAIRLDISMSELVNDAVKAYFIFKQQGQKSDSVE
jgi:hypothetical protein